MSKTAIWGGTDVSRSVTHVPVSQGWKQFVESQLDTPVPIPFSRREFLAFEKADRDRHKAVAFFLPCTLEASSDGSPVARTEPTGLRLACIDIDDAAVLDSGSLRSKIPWNFAAYRTANHTPEAPRLRIVVDLAPGHPLGDYKNIVLFLAQLLGLPETWKGRVESLKANQPMFRPIGFLPDAEHLEEEPPVFEVRTDGQPMPPGAWQTTAGDDDMVDPAFNLARPPIASITLDNAEAMLDTLDPDCARAEWIAVILALKHQFRTSPDAVAAFRLFDSWSAKGDKYKGTADCKTQWRSAKPMPATKGVEPVTIRSLMHSARLAGWDQAGRDNDCLTAFDSWVTAQIDPRVLETEGPKKLAEMKYGGIDGIPLEQAFNLLRKQHKAQSGTAVKEQVWRREVAKAFQTLHEAQDPEDEQALPPWLRPYVYIAEADVFFSRTTGHGLSPKAFDRRNNVHMMQKGSPKGAVPEMNASDYALNLAGIPRCDNLGYDPREQPGVIFASLYGGAARTLLNTFSPRVPVATPLDSALAGADLRSHFDILTGSDPLQTELLMQFTAHIVQHPGEKIRWVPLIVSIEGVGKTLWADILAAVIGRADVKTVGPRLHGEKFNAWQSGCVVVILEEICVVGESRTAIMDGLKEFISNNHVSMRLMRTDAFEVENTANAMAFTNHADGVHLTEDARRYFVVRCPLTKVQRDRLTAQGHFARLARWKEPLRAGSLRHFLLNYPIPDNFPVDGPAPDTTAKSDMVAEGQGEDWAAVTSAIGDPAWPLILPNVVAMKSVQQLLQPVRFARRASTILGNLGYHSYSEGATRAFRFGSLGQSGVMVREYDADLEGCSPVEFLRRAMVEDQKRRFEPIKD
jgi:hypothetical protein